MKRLIIKSEGETEVEFVKSILYPHFFGKGILVQPIVIKKSNGGIVNWSILKKEIELHLKSDPSAYLTTFIDYYGLNDSHGFPNWNEAHQIPDVQARISELEQALLNDIHIDLQYRFIPYIQLHEFEALLFIDSNVFINQIAEQDLIGRRELEETINQHPNPELINRNRETSPSHRLQRIIFG